MELNGDEIPDVTKLIRWRKQTRRNAPNTAKRSVNVFSDFLRNPAFDVCWNHKFVGDLPYNENPVARFDILPTTQIFASYIFIPREIVHSPARKPQPAIRFLMVKLKPAPVVTSRPRPSRKDRILRAYCWTLLLTTLYVFSLGPLSWQYYGALNLGESPLVGLYFAPVTILRQLWEPFDAWVGWYMNLWMYGLN